MAKRSCRGTWAAEDAWRGLSRLSRGDPAAAEAPLERAYEALARGQSSETAAALAEGLIRCRLASGRIEGIIDPWLTLLACDAAGTWSPDRGEALVDSATGLIPVLSPSLYAGLPHRDMTLPLHPRPPS